MSRRLRLIVPTLVLTAAGTMVGLPTAAAQGGGGGGGTPSTPPAADPCAPLSGTVYADGTVAGDFNEYGITGGCAVIVFGASFRATVYQVLPQPGWSYRLEVRDQSNGSRVTVEYSEAATGRVTSLRVEPGKTVVKQ
jgi:hypothetical protein